MNPLPGRPPGGGNPPPTPVGPDTSADAAPDTAWAWTRARARHDPLWAALLTLVVACVGSGTPQLWRDELASWSAADRTTGQLIKMLGNVDAVSGAYYLLLHGWNSVLGDSPAVLRMPSALAMAGAAAFVTLTARKLFDRRTAVFAGVLFALLPAVSKYGQEARSYAFAVLAAAAATHLLMRALERPTVARWLPYAAAVTAAGFFHIVSLLFLLPHALIVLGRARDARSWRLPARYAAAVAVALLPVIPLIVLGRRQVSRQLGWIAVPHLRDLAALWINLTASPLVALPLLAAAALPLAWSRGRRPAAELALVALVPIPAAWVLSQGATSYFLDRYLLFTLPAWVVLAAAGLGALRPRALSGAALVFMVALGAGDQLQLRTEYAKSSADGKGAAAIIAKGYEPGDGFAPAGGRLFMTDSLVEYYLPDHVKPKDVFVQRSAVANDDLFPVECTRPVQCLDGTRRIWMVTASGSPNPYDGFSPDQTKALKDHYTPVKSTKVGSLRVTLVERAR